MNTRLRSAAERAILARFITDPEEFYEEIIIPSGLFEEAYELFPNYNSSQSVDASEWMIQQIEDTLFDEGDPNWANMRDEVYDSCGTNIIVDSAIPRGIAARNCH